MDDLITLEEYKTLVGLPASNIRDDLQIAALIKAASNAVSKFIDRRFDSALGASSRTFQYDGSGILDVDDCTGITSIESDGGVPGGPVYTLDPSEYTPMPYRESSDDDPHYYIAIHGLPRSYSGAMGFARNLDTLELPTDNPVLLTVTATWGWPEVPADIKLATAWTVQDSLAKPSNAELRGESIEGYSRQYDGTKASSAILAIPSRARDLLANYERAY